MGKRTCSVDGCERVHYGRGWCNLHWMRWRKTGTTEIPPRRAEQVCEIEGCDKPRLAREWCKTHYDRWSRHGDPEKVLAKDQRANWRGGRTTTGNGYVLVLLPKDEPFRETLAVSHGRYGLEHRLVMTRHLGRPLLRDETVHHVNGDRTDNRIENLELWTSSHPAGQRVADKVSWAREILARYGEDYPDD